MFKEIVSLIESNEIDIMYTDEDNNSLGHIAVLSNDIDLLNYLIHKDIKLNNLNSYGATVLEIALQSGDLEMTKLLLENSAKLKNDSESFLHIACKSNNVDLVSFLLDERSINERDDSGWTPLFWAVQEKNFDVVKYLIATGADYNIVDENDYTPLMLAISENDIEMVNFFIQLYNKDNVKIYNIEECIELAKEWNYSLILKMLLAV